MTAARWARLSPLVDAALDLPPGQRRAHFDRLAAENPALSAEVEHLVLQCERSDSPLDSAEAERLSLLIESESGDARASDVMAQVQASLGTTYILERELGGGGMSRVFLAHEPGLDRKVVVKLLAPDLVAGISAERFEREIKLAASLQQANIVPLLAAGRSGDLPYYTMPFVEGQSLRDHLAREGPLSIRHGVSVLRDVARALAYAHERGVVHRDIKPGNVLLSGGTAVVTDFGIAKALTAARGAAANEALTLTGVGIGTLTYMAPEQAAGDPSVDHRADVYAFGCLAYEVFTGKPPFHGQPPHQIVAAHFRDRPQPLTSGRADAPPAITELVARCLEKDPARRPQSAVELLNALDTIGDQSPVPRRPRMRATVVAGGIAMAAVLAGGAYVLRAGGGGRQPRTQAAGTANMAALDQYRIGQALVLQRGTGVKNGVKAFEQAITLDPNFARAHAALATALELLPYFVGTPPSEVMDRAMMEARHALELDSTLAEAHSALGAILANSGQLDRGVSEFERAQALAPDSLEPRFTFGRIWITRGEVGKALVQFEQARRIAPVSAPVSAWIAYALFLDGRTDSAFAESRRAIQLDSAVLPVTNLIALMNIAQGNRDAARRLMRVFPPAGMMSNAPYVLAKLGDTTRAWRLVGAMESNDPRPWFTDVARATVLLALGDTARALDALETSDAASGSTWISFIPLLDPAFDPVRHSARFVALVRKARLNVEKITATRGRSPSRLR
jgi:tetratricopeptide (TPR) repeat protein